MKQYFSMLITVFLPFIFVNSVIAADINVATPVTATTINTAIASAQPGDCVIIPDGTYSGLSQITIPSDVDGTEANPITLKSATAGGVIFTGEPAEARVMFIQGDWWIIRDFKFIDISEIGDRNTYGIIIRNATGTRVTNTYWEGFGVLTDTNKRSWCIWAGGLEEPGHYSRVDHNTFVENEAVHITIYCTSSHCQVDHNYLKNSLKDGDNGFEGVVVGSDGCSVNLYTIVEYNLFENMGADAETISNKASNNTYRYNVFKSTGGATAHGIVLRGRNNCIIDGNYFFNIDKHSIRMHGAGHKITNNYFENPDYSAILLAEGSANYDDVVDILITNNTIVNPKVRGFHIGWWGSGGTEPHNLTFKNNIITSNVAGSYLVRDSGHTGTFTWTTNLHYITGSANYWQNDGGGNEPGSGITHANPSLVTGYDIYRLQAGSANAIENGTPDGNVTDDIDGHSRDGTNPDIGCDEYSASAPSRLPVEEHDVGVDWLRLKIFGATPITGTTGVPITIDLNWTNPNEENTNDGYFKVGACPCDAGDSVWTNQVHQTSYDPPGTLAYNTAHCWRVDIDHDGGTETGTDYGFTTTSQANPPTPEGSGMVWHKSGAKTVHHVKGLEIR